MASQQFVVTQIGSKKNSNPKLLLSEPWISEKNPSFPINIELTLRFPTDLDKLEIISHNQFIPDKIEILVKNSYGHKSIGDVLFKHKKSERHELKTVYVDDRCSQLLFRIHGYHNHDENVDNQVGLVEVKIYGTRVPDSDENSAYKRQGGAKEAVSSPKRIERKYTKELEDLARAVSLNKERSVEEENFRLAKQAQLAERLLAKSIGEMRKLETDKEEAIAEEDYQQAADINEEMKTLRAHILASIDSRLTENVPSDPISGGSSTGDKHRPDFLFDNNDELPHTPPKLFTPVDLSPEGENSLLQPPKKPSSHGSTRNVHSKGPRYSIPQTIVRTPPQRRRQSVERVTFRPSSKDSIISRRSYSNSSRSGRLNKFMEKENMIVPAALKNRQKKLDDEESGNIRNLPVEKEDHYLSVTNPKEQGDANRAAGILGISTMNKIFSRNFEMRREGLAEAKQVVQKSTSENSKAIFDAMIFVLSKTLRDPLYSVYSKALELLRMTICDFMPRYQMQKNGSSIASSTVEALLAKMGNSSTDKRTSQETENVFREIVDSNDKIAKGYLPHVMNTISTGNRLEKARAELVHHAMAKYNAPNSNAGLAEDTMRRFGVKCLQSNTSEVRNIGRDIMLRLYEKGDKRATRSALPVASRRSSIIEEIQRQMDQIDRK